MIGQLGSKAEHAVRKNHVATGAQCRRELWSSIAFRAQQRPDNFPHPAAPTHQTSNFLPHHRTRLLRRRLFPCSLPHNRNYGRSQPPDVCLSPVRCGTTGKAQPVRDGSPSLAPSRARTIVTRTRWLTLLNSTNLVIMLGMMQVSKRIPFDDPFVLNCVRGTYIASNLIIAILYLYVQLQINKKKGTITISRGTNPRARRADTKNRHDHPQVR